MEISEQMTRELAYQLWERAGRPDLRTEEFWFAAKAEFEIKDEKVKHEPGVRIRHSSDVRCETAADWGKRGRDPSF